MHFGAIKNGRFEFLPSLSFLFISIRVFVCLNG